MTHSTEGGRRVRRISRTKGIVAPGRPGWGPGLVAAVLPGLSRVGIGHGAPGDLDPTFAAGGVAITFGPQDFANALVLQPDGKLVVAGSSPGTSLLGASFLARFHADGRVDASFGLGGLVTTAPGGQTFARALRQQPDGKLVVAGSLSTGDASDILSARYQALGCPAVDPAPCLASLAGLVAETYQAAFARQPDAGEAACWVDVLTAEPTPDTVRGRLRVAFDGPEFRQRPVNAWQYAEPSIRLCWGGKPDQAELDWWVQAVLDRFNTLLPEFVRSPEFRRLVPSCQDQTAVTLLVGRLYQRVLRRVAGAEELAWWTQHISAWCALEEAVEFFFNSLEYLSVPRTLADHVTVLYRALLAHEPDRGARCGGWTTWLGSRRRSRTT